MGVMIYDNIERIHMYALSLRPFCPRRGQKTMYEKIPKRLDDMSKNGYIICVQRETDKPLSNH